MKTDKLFYRIFLSQPDLIAELLPGVPLDLIEFDPMCWVRLFAKDDEVTHILHQCIDTITATTRGYP